MKIEKIKKRDGRIVPFDQTRITNAIFKAITAVSDEDGKLSQKLSDQVVKILERRYKDKIPGVEDIQNIVEEVLILSDLVDIAKAYILYREQRRRIRESVLTIEEAADAVDEYLREIDWRINENANMTYSLQGLNNYMTTLVNTKYWLNRIYPPEIREANESGDFHIHNLGILAPYCMGWDLYDIITKGFCGAAGKIESKPAKHFRAVLGQIANFLYTLQGEAAGAEALSNFDTFLAPFIRYDKLSYPATKQAMQEFLFNCNVPTRVGFQTPFENITLDIKVPKNLAQLPVVIGGRPQKETYGEFQPEIDMINRAFAEVMMEGDAKGRPFSFPIPTINITKDFDWDNPSLGPMWEMTAKYGIPYFANFVNSIIKPEDVRSMCCRLRLDNRELYKRGGGLFGANPLTGSIGVVTINLPKIGYLAKNKNDFFKKLERVMELAKTSLEIKRKTIEELMEKGLYPYSRFYLSHIKKIRGSYWANHFATIGLVGMNEALLNFRKKNIASVEGKKFALEILDFMRDKLIEYQQSTGNMYNLEATPAESTAYRLALKDLKKYPEIVTAGKDVPYYTNSTQLPANYEADLFESLRLQDELQSKYTGGTVFHAWLGERLPAGQMVKKLIKKIFKNFKLPYFTFTPTFSICSNHGYIKGEVGQCPTCDKPTEIYSRVVGYLRPVGQWNKGKKEEFKQRTIFKIDD